MSDTKRDVVCWDCDDGAADLSYSDMDEAIEAEIEHQWLCDDPATLLAALPATLEVYGYARMPLPEHLPEPLEWLLDQLDDEYGGTMGGTEPTPAMLAAEAEFLRVIREQYAPWGCEVVETVTIVPADWIKEHRPEWLGEKE